MTWKLLAIGLISAFTLTISSTLSGQTSTPAARQQELSGGAAQPLSLKEAIDYTVKNQSAVKNAEQDVLSAKQKIREILGLGLPQLNATLDIQDFIQRATSLIPNFFGGKPSEYVAIQFGTRYNVTASAGLSQLVFDGTYLVGLKATGVYKQLAEKAAQRSRIDAAEAVTKAYYSVIVNAQRLKLFDANIHRLEKTFNDTRAYQQQGFAEQIDVDRLQVALSNLQVQQETSRRFLDVSLYLLKFQMGMPVSQNIALTDSLSFESIMAAPPADYNKRIEYSLLLTQQKFLGLDIQRQKAGYLPSLAFNASLGTSAQRNEFNVFNSGKWFATGLIGLHLSVPIFDGFQRDARVQQAKIALEKNKNDVMNLQNLIDFQVRSQQITYENTYKTLEIQKRNLDLADRVAKVSQIKFKEGVGSNLEVTTAESSLRESQINYFNALYDNIIARVDLQKAAGLLY